MSTSDVVASLHPLAYYLLDIRLRTLERTARRFLRTSNTNDMRLYRQYGLEE